MLDYITHDDSLTAQEEEVNERLGHAFREVQLRMCAFPSVKMKSLNIAIATELK